MFRTTVRMEQVAINDLEGKVRGEGKKAILGAPWLVQKFIVL